jgi:hypothetical protein
VDGFSKGNLAGVEDGTPPPIPLRRESLPPPTPLGGTELDIIEYRVPVPLRRESLPPPAPTGKTVVLGIRVPLRRDIIPAK